MPSARPLGHEHGNGAALFIDQAGQTRDQVKKGHGDDQPHHEPHHAALEGNGSKQRPVAIGPGSELSPGPKHVLPVPHERWRALRIRQRQAVARGEV